MSDVFVCREMTLSVGDEVGVSAGGLGGVPTIHTVTRVTHKGKRVRLDDSSEFNDRGHRVGSTSYNSRYLMTPEKARKLADPRDNFRAMSHASDRIIDRLNSIVRRRGSLADEFVPLTDDERAELMVMIERM